MDAVALVLWASLILLGVNPKPGLDVGRGASHGHRRRGRRHGHRILPHTGGLCQNLLRRLPLPIALRDRLIGLADQVLLGMRAFHNIGRFAGFAAFTVVIWISDAFGIMAGARALSLVSRSPWPYCC